MLSQGDDRTEAGCRGESCLFTLVQARSRSRQDSMSWLLMPFLASPGRAGTADGAGPRPRASSPADVEQTESRANRNMQRTASQLRRCFRPWEAGEGRREVARSGSFTLAPGFDVLFADAVLGITRDGRGTADRAGPRTGRDQGLGGTAADGVEPGRRRANRKSSKPKYAENRIANRRLFRPPAAAGGPSSPGTGNRDDRAIRANDRGPLPFGG